MGNTKLRMKRNFLIHRIILLMLFSATTSLAWAQSEDFTTWTKLKLKHKLDSRFALTGDLEMRTEDDMHAIDRWGVSVGGDYKALSFLTFELGYEAHYRNLGESGWKFRHRYRVGATASFRHDAKGFSRRSTVENPKPVCALA